MRTALPLAILTVTTTAAGAQPLESPTAQAPGYAVPPAPPPPPELLPEPPPRDRWFGALALYDRTNEGYGGRLDIDLADYGGWRVGAAASLAKTWTDLTHQGTLTGHLQLRDLKAVATVARVLALGDFQLRGAIGLGVVKTEAEGWGQPYCNDNPKPSQYLLTSDVATVFEATLTIARPIGRDWAIAGGLVITTYNQDLPIDDAYVTRDNVEIMWAAGIRRRI